MKQQYKIAIAGIGGVGGFYGAMLAKTFEHSDEVNVSFVARGAHMGAIQHNGIVLEKDSGNILAHPHTITDNPASLGPLDLIVFCCKGYDLEQLALSFSQNITPNTVLLPLLNGVGATEVLQRLYPQATSLLGCTYLVSKITVPGIVKMTGEMNQLLFGNPAVDQAILDKIESIFRATGVNVSPHHDIRTKTWEKFSFISPLATATSALNSISATVLSEPEKMKVLAELMQEIVAVAEKEDVNLPEDIIEVNLGKMRNIPAGATSSLHNDFRNGKNTELEMLTGYVVERAAVHGIEVPRYEALYTYLKESKPYEHKSYSGGK